jgi:hypothetical protein
MTEISRKKPNFPIQAPLRHYLKIYDREKKLPVTYHDLLRYSSSYPLISKSGKDTLWETTIYDQMMLNDLNKGLTHIYSLLKIEGDVGFMEHLFVDRIDYCTFGNSNPFRIRIKNQLNDNYDYFYVKKADASRVYGLELEHILSPNRINYIVHKDTLIEEHIAGIPGDEFIKDYLSRSGLNKVRIAKEFIKFNERCFLRLLGDMRSYNYVLEITPDFEDSQYRVRSIDFDQQSFEGKRTMYLPQFFKDNLPVVQLCMETMTMETMRQYQYEERTLMARRLRQARYRIKDLVDTMRQDKISTNEKITQLKTELARHYENNEYLRCTCMGDILRLNFKFLLKHTRPK